ncbi:DUF975 family protein [Butyrivibrio sp. YAB3001]|uniref:DUF975 family protein n=1 Tax=Butyrivibrio sp. YAB3001 TaxID=1520812 RepID=UPI0008F6795B|nr:DUF975 family protein [Butyrivibrio sp. YAB3001]SFC20292.1 Uncharacterized membrane protein [Butyrivibrio sp. YAB3001]
MSNSVSAAQLKATARERSLDKYGTLILANIMIFVIQVFISGITTVATSGSLIILIINQLITLIVNILLGVLVSGKAYLYLNLVYSQTISASDIFFGLKQHPEKAVIIQSVFVLVDFLVSLPASLLLFFLHQNTSLNLILGLTVALIIGLIIDLYIILTYSQAFFLLHDFPDRSARNLLATSRNLMKGNRIRLLCLYLSFIPMYLLGIVTLFIPLLWISVYRYATVTSFYQDLISKAGNNASN